MEKVLNQEEIDAMVRAARSGGGSAPASPDQPKVELWDARRAGQIGREQLQAITLLHESFARSLTHALGAYLRVVFAAALVSAENLTYREFLQRLPETTYLASCRLEPMGLNGALQLDLKVAFPIIDLLLGGEGKGMPATREITEIEEQILDSVARIICRELGVAWQALSLEVGFDERLETGAAHRLMAPEEKTLSLSFEVTMPDVRGGLNLALPAAVSNALLRKISANWSYRRPKAGVDARERLMRRLLDSVFQAELGAKDVRVAVSDLAELAPGTVLPFARSVTEPASLLIAGREMFRALPARYGKMRAARLLERVSESDGASTAHGRKV
ncbi:MAG TPA: FliM/FliN family flagellar motor switch protein [Candidatus Solibacter sp.]|nr:FliM/FliN family flagellar motor switch protein [Candidatus Solibacter sp.]